MPTAYSITTSYVFSPLPADRLQELHDALTAFGDARDMRGLVLIATEGMNATVCGTSEAVAEWKEYVTSLFGAMEFKDSTSSAKIFRRWSVKVKAEIVAIKNPTIHPKGSHRHLPPAQWREMMLRDDVVVLDTRNKYEVELGTFRKAVDPAIKRFHEFPEYVRTAPLPKDKPILVFCTGGIRCEKAVLAMEQEGYDNVYQLEGGILAYLKEFPHQEFDGECFVFDKRVSVDQELQPSKIYKLCTRCGDPAKQDTVCALCKEKAAVVTTPASTARQTR